MTTTMTDDDNDRVDRDYEKINAFLFSNRIWKEDRDPGWAFILLSLSFVGIISGRRFPSFTLLSLVNNNRVTFRYFFPLTENNDFFFFFCFRSMMPSAWPPPPFLLFSFFWPFWGLRVQKGISVVFQNEAIGRGVLSFFDRIDPLLLHSPLPAPLSLISCLY